MARTDAKPGPFFIRRLFRIYPWAITTVLFIAGLKWLYRIHIDRHALLSNPPLEREPEHAPLYGTQIDEYLGLG